MSKALDNNVLNNMFMSKRDAIIGSWRAPIEELHDLLSS